MQHMPVFCNGLLRRSCLVHLYDLPLRSAVASQCWVAQLWPWSSSNDAQNIWLCCVGGPHGAMATLENALSSVFGHQSFASGKGLSKLGLVHEANSKEEALTQTLKQLMMQQSMERLQFKEKVRRWCLTGPKECTALICVSSKCWRLPCKTRVCVVTCYHNLLTRFVRFKYHAQSRLVITVFKPFICA